jgi:short/branched chain acyl-CoA dehydrogenase
MFELTEEHEHFRQVVRDFAESEIAPQVAAWDRESYFPVELIPRLGDLGLFGIVVPEEYGGQGGDFTSLCIAIEELGRIDQSIGITLSAGVGLGINPILTYGTHEQKEKYLPDLVTGRALAGFGLTEPEAGSDAGATQTHAEHHGDEWVINGSKAFITNAGTSITSVVTVTARTGANPDGSPEISALMIPSGTKGFTVDPPYHKLGWHISDTHGLSFDNCKVPDRQPPRPAWGGLQAVPQDPRRRSDRHQPHSRSGAPSGCLRNVSPTARAASPSASPIGVNQGVSFQVADLAVMADDSRQLTYKAAWLKDEQDKGDASRSLRSSTRPPSRKLYTSEAAVAPRRGSPPRSSAATASWRNTRSPGSTATPRSSRSARARPRSSGCSSLAASVCPPDLPPQSRLSRRSPRRSRRVPPGRG